MGVGLPGSPRRAEDAWEKGAGQQGGSSHLALSPICSLSPTYRNFKRTPTPKPPGARLSSLAQQALFAGLHRDVNPGGLLKGSREVQRAPRGERVLSLGYQHPGSSPAELGSALVGKWGGHSDGLELDITGVQGRL